MLQALDLNFLELNCLVFFIELVFESKYRERFLVNGLKFTSDRERLVVSSLGAATFLGGSTLAVSLTILG